MRVYGDESMDETKQRVCAVAVVCGSELEWQSIENRWVDRTKGIPFHAKDCDSDHGAYSNTPHAENMALYRDLTVILANSEICGFGAAVDLIAQRQVLPGSDELAYYKAFSDAIGATRIRAQARGEIAEIIFDTRVETNHNAGLLYANLRDEVPDWKERLAPKISFECSQENPRLQVADLFAREAMKALDNEIGPVKRSIRGSWNALRETGRFVVHSYSYDWFRDLRNDFKRIERESGCTRQDFQEWLRKNGRQRNISNLFTYVKDK